MTNLMLSARKAFQDVFEEELFKIDPKYQDKHACSISHSVMTIPASLTCSPSTPRHFDLSHIFDWIIQSDTCPQCRRVMDLTSFSIDQERQEEIDRLFSLAIEGFEKRFETEETFVSIAHSRMISAMTSALGFFQRKAPSPEDLISMKMNR